MLERAVAASGMTKTAVIEQALLGLVDMVRGARVDTAALAKAVRPSQAGRMPAPTERRQAAPHRGTAAELGHAVLAKGRREATVVATGERVAEGKVR